MLKIYVALFQGLWKWFNRWISYVCRAMEDGDKFISNTGNQAKETGKMVTVFRLMVGAILGLLSSHVVEGQSLVHRTKVWERWGGSQKPKLDSSVLHLFSQRNPSRHTVLYYIYSLPCISTPPYICCLHMGQDMAIGSQKSLRKRTQPSGLSVISGMAFVPLALVLTPVLFLGGRDYPVMSELSKNSNGPGKRSWIWKERLLNLRRKEGSWTARAQAIFAPEGGSGAWAVC